MAANLWLEAESGAEYSPIVVKAAPDASQAIHLGSWKWADYSYRNNAAGKISFEVYVSEAGTYRLWGRARLPDGSRPFDISFGNGDVYDDSQWTRWQSAVGSDYWRWSNSGYSTYLSAGSHTLHLIQRDGGPYVHLDKILLTSDSAYSPSDLGGAEAVLNIENPYRASAVGKYGQLRLVGTQLSDKNNQPVQLKGISLHGLQWFPVADDLTVPTAAEFFGADTVRLAMYVEAYAPTDPADYWGGFMADKAAMYQRVDMAIADAVNAGVYVLVDWHIHNVPDHFTSDAVEFFNYISSKYGHLPNIIYEICNEPTAVTWSGGIKPYATTVINAIRQHDPDNIIIVGTPNWSQDVDAAAQDPLNFSNIMYAFHFYAATHDINVMKGKVETALNAGLPIFVSEWGSSDVGTSRINLDVAKQWVDFMNMKKLSWINWSLGNKDETSSILKPAAPLFGPWNDTDLTQAGAWVKSYFNAPEAEAEAEAATLSTLESGARYRLIPLKWKSVGNIRTQS